MTHKPIVFFDLETTGTDTLKDRIVQFAATTINEDGEKTSYNYLINPGIPIPQSSTDIHGITDEMVKLSPRFEDVALEIMGIFHGKDIGGYNISKFDIPLLYEEIARCGREWDISDSAIVDVFLIDRKLRPRTLEYAYLEWTGKKMTNAHDASSDTDASIDVWQSMVEKNKEIGDSAIDWERYYTDPDNRVDFNGSFAVKDGVVVFNFGKYKGLAVRDRHPDIKNYLNWMTKNDFPTETKNWASSFLEEYHS